MLVGVVMGGSPVGITQMGTWGFAIVACVATTCYRWSIVIEERRMR